MSDFVSVPVRGGSLSGGGAIFLMDLLFVWLRRFSYLCMKREGSMVFFIPYYIYACLYLILYIRAAHFVIYGRRGTVLENERDIKSIT